MPSYHLDAAMLESAAGWYVDLRAHAADPSLQAAHGRWLEQDPRHRQAWDRVLRLQARFERLSSPSVARATISGAAARRRDVLKILSILLAAGTAVTLGRRTETWAQWAADLRTQTGEQRLVQLQDGTELHLNTATSVNVRYGPRLRELELLCGEILVSTAKDAAGRPLVVHTEEGSLRALGTRFTVLREAASSRLSVLEHAVEVRPAAQPQALATVTAGQQLSFTAQALGAVTPADPQADAWLRHMLIVSNWRLHDFVRQLQRYRPGVLSCDAGVAELRLSGAFNLNNTDGVLENLCRTLPVQARQFTRYWVRIEAV